MMPTKTLFNENDFVQRGTEGLAFELLQVTSNILLAEVSHRKKIVGNFLAETENNANTVTYYRDPNWMGGSMMFKDIIRNKDNDIVFVAMQRLSTPKGTFFRMGKELQEEIVCISQDFENIT